MKKVFILLAASATMFASCTKDYTCTCTDNSGNTQTVTFTKTTKRIAKANCVSTSETNGGITTTNTCTLK